MDKETLSLDHENGTAWVIMSPYLVAQFMFNTMFVVDNEFPEVGKLHYHLMQNFNLGVKLSELEHWREQFIFIH